jgi:S1-C subfamily serine protease
MSSSEKPYTELYRDVAPSVVSVYTNGSDPRQPQGAGSGFVYDDRHIVTNQHVVRDVPTVEIRFSEGDWRTGNVVGTDAYTDLAVVEVDSLPTYVTPLPVAATSPVPGEPVAAFGNPMGLDGTVSTGVVSGVNRSMPTDGGFAIPDTVQTDAPINPGNSGGPLVTTDGEVVGVNRARGGDNIGFAISPAIVARVVPDLVTEGQARHATLHVSTLDVSPTVAEANDVDPGGVLVVDVRRGPASGVLGGCNRRRRVNGRDVPIGGDVIVGIDDLELHSHEELMRYLITERRPGDTAELRVRRRTGETVERVRLADREAPTGSPPRDGVRIDID